MKYYLLLIVLILFSCTNNQIEDGSSILSSENKIISFKLIKNDYSKTFSTDNQDVIGTVDSNINLTNIQLLVTISENATISPNPLNITSLVEPIDFTVRAENGNENIYTISIQSEGNSEKKITNFKIITDSYIINTSIDDENSLISQKLPPHISLDNIAVEFEKSDNSTITPSPEDINNYSTPVDFTIISENGLEKIYTVNIESMASNVSRDCDLEENAWKWFGGDDRTVIADIPEIPFNRNVGTGQAIIVENDSNPTQFSVEFREAFRYSESGIIYDQPLDIKLNIRNQNGVTFASKTTTIPASFNGGWVNFDLVNLKLFLKKDSQYIFTWHLVNGENLGVKTGSPATHTINTGNCYTQSYAGVSKISNNTDIEDWSSWYPHQWYFNYKLEGLE